MFCKKGVHRNFAKFTGKHLCQGLYFNKVAGLRSTNLLKKRPWRKCFALNFTKFLRTPFLTEHLRWLLLKKHFSSFLFLVVFQQKIRWSSHQWFTMHLITLKWPRWQKCRQNKKTVRQKVVKAKEGTLYESVFIYNRYIIWDKVLKSGLCKFCGRQPLNNCLPTKFT